MFKLAGCTFRCLWFFLLFQNAWMYILLCVFGCFSQVFFFKYYNRQTEHGWQEQTLIDPLSLLGVIKVILNT